MSTPIDLVHQGFALVIAIALVLVGAAMVGGLAGVAVARLFGVQDASMAAITRGAAIFAALAVFGGGWAADVQAFTVASWSMLGEKAPP